MLELIYVSSFLFSDCISKIYIWCDIIILHLLITGWLSSWSTVWGCSLHRRALPGGGDEQERRSVPARTAPSTPWWTTKPVSMLTVNCNIIETETYAFWYLKKPLFKWVVAMRVWAVTLLQHLCIIPILIKFSCYLAQNATIWLADEV